MIRKLLYSFENETSTHRQKGNWSLAQINATRKTIEKLNAKKRGQINILLPFIAKHLYSSANRRLRVVFYRPQIIVITFFCFLFWSYIYCPVLCSVNVDIACSSSCNRMDIELPFVGLPEWNPIRNVSVQQFSAFGKRTNFMVELYALFCCCWIIIRMIIFGVIIHFDILFKFQLNAINSIVNVNAVDYPKLPWNTDTDFVSYPFDTPFYFVIRMNTFLQLEIMIYLRAWQMKIHWSPPQSNQTHIAFHDVISLRVNLSRSFSCSFNCLRNHMIF